jgi:starch-binding outer membrane protein SusE/F
LLELYIPLKAGAAGFQIAKVAGTTKTYYGPGTNFADVTQGTTDEPKVTFQRGSMAEGTVKFTVPADGMYHVVVDTELGIVVIVPVHWGIIGGATPNGWGGSLQMTESAFNATKMDWTLTGVELRGGEWKFRYSEGWKVEIDPNIDLGGGVIGVKVNTNFGGTVAALVPGGDNIANTMPGIYNIKLEYELGKGYKATVTKTGDLPMTNWTGVELDAVGSGVSADNPNAIPDPSSWGWGNQLIADNGGVPVKNGDIYTWTWNGIILEASQGFKLRTLNGVTPPVGGANFDAGFGALDVAASSNKVVDDGGNLSVNAKGPFNITLTIDAADSDKIKIVITE